MNIVDYLKRKGWKYKEASNQYQVAICPFCNDEESHFYMSQEHGAYDCKKCGKSGSFYGLQKKLGDIDIFSAVKKTFVRIQEPEIKKELSAIKYLLNRGLSLTTINKFEVICEAERIGFVYKSPEKETYLIKWRTIGSKKFYSEPENTPIHYPYNIQNVSGDTIIITEGEIDCLTWFEYGYENVIAIPGANSFKGEWLQLLEHYKTVYLSLDMDIAGQEATNKILQKLGKYRCKKINLPYKDINECLQKKLTKEDIAEIVKNAETFKNDTVISSSDVKLKLAKKEDFGITTGWKSMDELNMWRPSELTVMTGETKNGKTIFMVNNAFKQAWVNNPVLIGSFEIGVHATQRKIYSMAYNKSFYAFNQQELDIAHNLVTKMPLYYIANYGGMDIVKLKDCVYFAALYYDIKFVLLDHLHFFAKMKSDGNMAFEIGCLMKEIKSWCMELGIHIWLIVHPSKVPTGQRITENDLRGSSDIKQIADNVYRIYARKDENKAEITLLIGRHELSSVGTIDLMFNKDSLNYTEEEFYGAKSLRQETSERKTERENS